MAVDTRNKRFSLLNLSLGAGRVFPEPDGAIDTGAERAQYVLSYALVFVSAAFNAWWAQGANRTIGMMIEPK